MWKFFAARHGKTEELQGIILDGPPSADAQYKAAREGLRHKGLLKYFEQEAKLGINGTRNGVELWAKAVNSDWLRLNRTATGRFSSRDEAVALVIHPDDPAVEPRPTALAWDDHTSFILPLDGDEEQITIEYTPEKEDSERVRRLMAQYGSQAHRVETLLDFRAFYGTECALCDGMARMWHTGGHFAVKLWGKAFALVGKTLRVASELQPAVDRDLRGDARLALMQAQFPDVAAACPSFSTMTAPVKTEAAVVFVHGALSCGLAGLSDICADGFKPRHIYRFEHDTFRPIRENGIELADYIVRYLDVKRLLIAAHSRGGLVGRVALKQLLKRNYPAHVTLHTFGAPHDGTPVVAVAAKSLSLLYRAGESVVGLLPAPEPLTKAISLLVDPPQLPPGIDIMRVDSDARKMLDDEELVPHAICTSSAFPADGTDSGFGITAQNFLQGIFLGAPNDLVVPTASAQGFGAKGPVLACSHMRYFRELAVQDVIRGFVPPETLPPPPPPPPAGTIYQDGPNVIIGGVSVPIRK